MPRKKIPELDFGFIPQTDEVVVQVKRFAEDGEVFSGNTVTERRRNTIDRYKEMVQVLRSLANHLIGEGVIDTYRLTDVIKTIQGIEKDYVKLVGLDDTSGEKQERVEIGWAKDWQDLTKGPDVDWDPYFARSEPDVVS